MTSHRILHTFLFGQILNKGKKRNTIRQQNCVNKRIVGLIELQHRRTCEESNKRIETVIEMQARRPREQHIKRTSYV